MTPQYRIHDMFWSILLTLCGAIACIGILAGGDVGADYSWVLLAFFCVITIMGLMWVRDSFWARSKSPFRYESKKGKEEQGAS